MFKKMLLGALLRQKGKLIMVALTVALGVSLATAMLNVMFDVGDKVNRELKTYGANLNVVPRGASLVGELYNIEDSDNITADRPEKFLNEADLDKIKMIFWAYNIVDFAPYLKATVIAGGSEVTLVGTWFDRHLVLPTGDEVDTGMLRLKSWWEINGRPGDDNIINGAMVGGRLAERLNVRPGDSFSITTPAGEKELVALSVFDSGGDEDEQAFVPLALTQEIRNLPGLVQNVEISALTTPENELARRAAQDPNSLSRSEWDAWYCTAYISSIAYQIEEVIPDARVKAVLQVADSEGAILQKTQMLMLLLTFLILACSVLAISNLVTANVMERGSEIGLMKALGAGSLFITMLMLSEVLITAMAGGILGYLLGLSFAQIIGHSVFGSGVEIKGVVIPLVVIVVFIITMLGSIPAVRYLLSLKPSQVLKG